MKLLKVKPCRRKDNKYYYRRCFQKNVDLTEDHKIIINK